MQDLRENFNLKKRLVDKSIEAYILALETINRLTVEYRLETFCYLICNAWELLLKARILEDADEPDSIYYKERDGETKRSLSLWDCLNRTMQNEKDPIRRNIERIKELRDESAHLVISQIPPDLIGLFQASVINYHKFLQQWFDESLADRYPVGMMSIAYDRSPEQWDLSNQRLQQQLGRDATTFLARYCAEIKQELDEFQCSTEFSIGNKYKLVLTKRSNDADVKLYSGADGEPTQIVEVAKDPSVSHPFRQKEVIEQVNAAIADLQINQFDIRCINKVYNIKTRSEYFYQGKIQGSPGQYSQAFVDWLVVEQYQKDNQFFCKARAKAKEMSTR